MSQRCKPDALISLEELALWVPGTVICSSEILEWKDVSQCSYHCRGQDVEIPPMERFMVVRYHTGETSQLSRAQVSRLQEYIDAHLQSTITLAELAEVLNLGIWTFGRQVQRTLGCTAQSLVMKHRIERAQTLLTSHQLALKQVAAACGFSDQAHMTRSFRTHTGRSCWSETRHVSASF